MFPSNPNLMDTSGLCNMQGNLGLVIAQHAVEEHTKNWRNHIEQDETMGLVVPVTCMKAKPSLMRPTGSH